MSTSDALFTAEPTPTAPPPEGWARYLWATRTATYGFLAALPLVLLYEALILVVNVGQPLTVRISAEVWMKGLLAGLGIGGLHVLAGVVLLVGLAILYVERRKGIPMRTAYFGGILGESLVYAVVLAGLVSAAVGALFAFAPTAVLAIPPAVPQAAAQGLGTKLALSLGAGIYEELLFRVLLVGGLYAGLRRLLKGRTQAYVIAAVVGALVFSAVHYMGALGDPFTLPSFTFRFLFGLALNVVFLVRGFGVAAWTHAIYDVLVVTGLLG